MPSLTIKGIPEEVMERLRRQAESHRRSLNSEVIHLLEHSVAHAQVPAAERLQRIRRLQRRAPLPALTENLLKHAVDDERP